jgi:hypothetical protein|tara:strand:- start:947 stop:1198 length:252 start_codon:yes stop_codon:yes gene_type:complete
LPGIKETLNKSSKSAIIRPSTTARLGSFPPWITVTFSEAKYQIKKRKAHREIFLERMDKLIPWKQLEKKVARHYPKWSGWSPA